MATLLARNALALARARGAATSLTAARALSTGVSMQAPGVVNPALLMMINPVSAPAPAIIDPFVRNPILFEINPSFQITQTPEIAPAMIECPTNAVNEPLLAVKRTYQPSVLRRKRKHGFRSRVVSIGGRKVLKRRFLKGRWRMSL